MKREVYIIHFFIIMICVILCSCENELLLNRQNENKLVVLAEITAEDSAYIPVSASMPVGNGSVVQFQKVTDASVIISGGGMKNKLRYNGFPGFNNIPAAIYSNPQTFMYNTDYNLEIEHPVFGTVSAFVHIPLPVTIKNVKSAESELYGREILKFSFDIEDAAGEKNYYIFEAVKQFARVTRFFYWQGVRYDYNTPAGEEMYEWLEDEYDIEVELHKDTAFTGKYLRLDLFVADAKTGNNQIGSLDSSFKRIFLTDSLFDGKTYSSTFSIAMSHFEAQNSTEKGIVIVRVKSVDKSFYDYMLQYEKYKTDFGNMPVTQLTSPAGNIKNGLGIFGGSSKREWKFYYDDLED